MNYGAVCDGAAGENFGVCVCCTYNKLWCWVLWRAGEFFGFVYLVWRRTRDFFEFVYDVVHV